MVVAFDPPDASDLEQFAAERSAALGQVIFRQGEGVVVAVRGPSMTANLPGAAIGEVVSVVVGDAPRDGRVLAQVVALAGPTATLAPLGDFGGLSVGAKVRRVAPQLSVRVGDSLLGRVLDGLGKPMDGKEPIKDGAWWPVERFAPHPLGRHLIRNRLVTGVRAIDGLLTLGEGQRVGIFAPAGTGKSFLLSHIGRGLLREDGGVDVAVVGLIGERGREVRVWLDEHLPGPLRERMVVVVSTGDQVAQQRVNCALVATAIAEHFRDQKGYKVLLLIDSLTRLARAHRDVAVQGGELPVRQGYPASLLGFLAKLIERAGTGVGGGSITAMYTVLTQAAQAAVEDPIADEVAGLLDGHLVLSSAYAAAGHWPALDVPSSLSRLAASVITKKEAELARDLRRLIAAYQENREVLAIAGHRPGVNQDLDDALALWPEVEGFLQQPPTEHSAWEDTQALLKMLVG